MELTQEHYEKIDTNAKQAARRYKRRCWWASVEDLEQEAYVAQLKAAHRYDPKRGTARRYNKKAVNHIEFGQFTWRIAVLACRRLLLKASAPVSAHHRLQVLKRITHIRLTVETADGERERKDLPHVIETPEVFAERAERSRQVKKRLIELLGKNAEFALSVLSDEYRPKEIAKYHRLPVTKVYREAKRAKKALKFDTELWQIFRDW